MNVFHAALKPCMEKHKSGLNRGMILKKCMMLVKYDKTNRKSVNCNQFTIIVLDVSLPMEIYSKSEGITLNTLQCFILLLYLRLH